MTGTRIDKWLWAARFFKTREQASRACDLNRIASNGQPAKPSREVRLGDLLQIRNGREQAGPREGCGRAQTAGTGGPVLRTEAFQARPPPHPQLSRTRLRPAACTNAFQGRLSLSGLDFVLKGSIFSGRLRR